MNVEIILTIAIIMLVAFGVLSRESDIDIAVKRTKTLENRLKQELNVKGDGLKQLTENAKPKLPREIYEKLIAKIIPWRNDVVHKVGHNNLSNRGEFIQSCNSVEHTLDELKLHNRSQKDGFGCLIVFSIIVAMAYFLSQNPG